MGYDARHQTNHFHLLTAADEQELAIIQDGVIGWSEPSAASIGGGGTSQVPTRPGGSVKRSNEGAVTGGHR